MLFVKENQTEQCVELNTIQMLFMKEQCIELNTTINVMNSVPADFSIAKDGFFT
jgi:hypothetical protein